MSARHSHGHVARSATSRTARPLSEAGDARKRASIPWKKARKHARRAQHEIRRRWPETLTALSVFGAATLVLWQTPRGWPTYFALSGLILACLIAFSALHHRFTSVARVILATLAATLTLATVAGAAGKVQRVLQSVPGPAQQFIPQAYGTPSQIQSKTGVAKIYKCPRHTCKIVARLRDGTQLVMRCWTDTEWFADRYRSNRWFKVSFLKAGHVKTGFRALLGRGESVRRSAVLTS